MLGAPRLKGLRWTRSAGWGVGLILLGIVSWWFFAGDGVDRSIVYTIDYGNDVPFHYKGPDGLPTGLAVDLVREAARAKGIQLEWAQQPQNGKPPHPLRVLLSVRTNLFKDLHFTEPYLQGRSTFVVASNSPIRTVSDLRGKRISYPNYAIHRENLARVLPNHIPTPATSSVASVEKIMAGEADAAFMSDYAVVLACLNVPSPFGVRLLPAQAPLTRMALAAPHKYARLAEVLRDGIRDMAVDGRLEKIVDHWGFFPNLTTDRREELIKEKRKVLRLQVTTGFLLAMVGVSGWLINRLRIERALARAAESKQSATLNALPAHIALLNKEGEVVAVNESWRGFADQNVLQSPDFCVGQNYLRLCERAEGAGAGEARLAAAGLRKVLNGQARDFMLEYPCHSPTEQRWFRLMVAPLSDSHQAGAVVMHINITDRMQAELALKSSEQKSRAIVESSPVPMAVHDDQQRITFLNHAFVKTFGYTLEDIPTLSDWWPKAYPEPLYRGTVVDAWRTERERARQSATEFQPMELRIRARDRTDRVVLATASLLHGLTRSEHLVVLVDITDRKRQEIERQKLEQQLRHAQKMDAIGVLAGGIAHDFNNILVAIMGYASLAGLSITSDHPAHRFIDELHKATARATALVRQILAFSRKEVREPRIHNMQAVVEEATQLLRSTLPAGVQVTTSFDRAALALVDPTEIHQVVINLGANAWHALDGRPGEIRVSVEPVTVDADQARSNPDLDAGAYVRLTVSDNGHGMTPEIMEHIFEPFFTTKEVGKGTGLGLAVVHGIVKSHQGAILVKSEPGQGATFELYFPAASGPILPPFEPAPTRPEIRGQNQRILLVDDEEQVVDVTVGLLDRHGFRASGFTRPEVAFKAFEAAPDQFDLVITDFNMPIFSGLELARKIRQIRPSLPIILVSGFITEEVRMEAETVGITHLANKPILLAELLQIIHRISLSNPPPSP